jgi:hypothetical protein
MRRRLILSGFALALAAALAASWAIHAQTATPSGRGLAAAQTAAAAPAPSRDLTGVWTMRNPAGMNGRPEPPALTAWGLAKFKEAKASNGGSYTLDQTNDPVITKCFPPGVPRVYYHPFPFEVVHTPKYTLLLYEYDHMVRRVHTDGRPLPEDPDLLWMGTSVGRWEDDTTLAVDTVGFNGKTWLDRAGHAHSDQLKVNERFHRVDRDHVQLDVTMTDPKALTKPWSLRFYYELRPKWELGELSCSGDNPSFTAFER